MLYLYTLNSKTSTTYSTRQSCNILSLNVYHKFFKASYLSFTYIKCNNSDFRASPSYSSIKKRILELVRELIQRSFPSVPNSLGLTYLIWIGVGLTHLCNYKFCHNFRDWMSQICDCGEASETTKHYLFQC